MKIVFLTAGAAGMFCGSCMHDNALAKALRREGADCLLQPLYTPIRTDESSVADTHVFFGGVNIYLLDKMPLFRFVPAFLKRLLDRPGFLAWATRRAGSTDAKLLGDLTLSMLSGEAGNQAEEVARLVAWLRDEIRPDAILFTNLLIAGVIPVIRRELPQTKLIAILQGDDAFLDHLPSPYRERAELRIGELGRQCDAIVVNSTRYGESMAGRLGLEAARLTVLPLTIDTAPFRDFVPKSQRVVGSGVVRIGYFARIAPEKGLHNLIDAFIDLCGRPGCDHVRLDFAGWLGEQNRGYLEEQLAKLERAGLGDRAAYLGSPDLRGKLAMLGELDLFSVPTSHEEPKGLSVLEALAAGVPVVLPAKGAFPELVESTGGGLLVDPDDPHALADGLYRLVRDVESRRRFGLAGREHVMTRRGVESQARQMIEMFGPQPTSG